MEEAEEESSSGRTLVGTWQVVYNALLQLLIMDAVLTQPYDSVSRTVHRDEEDEASYSDLLIKASLLCRHVLTNSEVVNSYIHWLDPYVMESIGVAVSLMSN